MKFTGMTDGDITRLNRMYKCPNFEENEVEVFEESESSLSDELEKRFDFGKAEDEVNEQSDTEIASSPASLMNSLKSLAQGLSKLIKPLCNYEKKLQLTLKNVH